MQTVPMGRKYEGFSSSLQPFLPKIHRHTGQLYADRSARNLNFGKTLLNLIGKDHCKHGFWLHQQKCS